MMRNPSGFEFYPGRRLPVVCRDGVTRSAVCTGYADQVLPAAVQVTVAGKRRTVSGFIYNPRSVFLKGWTEDLPRFAFTGTGTNAALIPLTSHKPRLATVARKLIAAVKCVNGDHSPAAMADVCRTEAAGLTEPAGQESPGWIARRILSRLWEGDVKRLAVYFDRLSKLDRIPPPPPPLA
jgi:hypothetical protein